MGTKNRMAMFDTPSSRELAEVLYSKLTTSSNGELSFNQILDVFDSKPEYGLNRVNGGAIHLVKMKPNVVQMKDEQGRPFLKLIQP